MGVCELLKAIQEYNDNYDDGERVGNGGENRKNKYPTQLNYDITDKAILISIQPLWVKKILSGEKTIEIRKTMPKCKLPCKVYIYCTKSQINDNHDVLNGKVVAEFTLDYVKDFTIDYCMREEQTYHILKNACVDICDVMKYRGKNRVSCLFAWHIYNLVIYDKPKELSEFVCKKQLKRPPQSWCYVEK